MIAERAVRRIKEGTSTVLLQTGLDEKWSADSMELLLSAKYSGSFYLMGNHHMKGGSE